MNSIIPIKEIEFFIRGMFQRSKLHIRFHMGSVVSNSLQPYGLQPARLLCPWILHARIREWVTIPFSRGFSPLRGWTLVSCIAGRFFTIWAPRGAYWYVWKNRTRNKYRHSMLWFQNSIWWRCQFSIKHFSLQSHPFQYTIPCFIKICKFSLEFLC